MLIVSLEFFFGKKKQRAEVDLLIMTPTFEITR